VKALILTGELDFSIAQGICCEITDLDCIQRRVPRKEKIKSLVFPVFDIPIRVAHSEELNFLQYQLLSI